MLTTADGFEFTVGVSEWKVAENEWQTSVIVAEGDKRHRLVVATGANVKATAVHGCVENSMRQYMFRGATLPAKVLKGGV